MIICCKGNFMKEMTWYKPTQIEEVPSLLEREGVKPHGGGTWILRGSLKNTRGLIDLSHLPLGFFRAGKSYIEIGPCITYAETAHKIEQIDPGHVLVKALRHAASTPLRNRITVGGTISVFPAWSDLMGPLLALDAEISLIGRNEGTYPVEEYVKTSNLRKNSLITSIRIRNEKWNSFYHREIRTSFDYPTFTVTILMKKAGQTVKEIRAVVVGSSGKYRRLDSTEESIRGRRTDDLIMEEAAGLDEIRFTRKKGLDPDYTGHLFRVALERGLESAAGG
jgi:CO/xanthine dehydrogenase FAD-binding subunit